MKARILRGMVILLSVHAGSLEEKLWFLTSRTGVFTWGNFHPG